jgi:hypothetical protein
VELSFVLAFAGTTMLRPEVNECHLESKTA